MKKQQLIVVLGMHRSGTSAITRSLQALGIDLGGNLYEGDPTNKKGYWEDIEINELDTEILKAVDKEWHYLASINETNIEALRAKGFHQRATKLLLEKVGGSQLWGFKDPRVTKLLPFWKEVFLNCNFDVFYILALRNPSSIADSLARRDNFEPEKSYLLTLEHWLSALQNTRNEKLIIVDYDQLLVHADIEIQKISSALGLEINQQELQKYTSDFLETKLQHSNYDLDHLSHDKASHPLLIEVYQYLSQISREEIRIEDEIVNERINAWVAEFVRLSAPCSLADKLYSQKFRGEQTIREKDKNISVLNDRINNLAGEIATQNQEIDTKDQKICELGNKVTERVEQIDALNRNLDEQTEEIAKFREHVADRDKQIATLDRKVLERDRRLDKQTEEIAKFREHVADRDKQIATLDRKVLERDRRLDTLRQKLDKQTTFSNEAKLKLLQRAELVSQLSADLVRLQQDIQSVSEQNSYKTRRNEQTVDSFMRSAFRPLPPSPLTRVARRLNALSRLSFRRERALISASPLFDENYYLKHYPDVKSAGVDPVSHYHEFGWRECRNPSEKFNTAKYLFCNPDVAAAGVNPLLHYLRNGHLEGREIYDSSSHLLPVASLDKPEFRPNIKIALCETLDEVPIVSEENSASYDLEVGENCGGATLLFIDYAVPMYDQYAGSRTNYMYLKLLVSMGLNVKFLPADFRRREPYTNKLHELGIQTLDGNWFEDNWQSWFREHGKRIDFVFFNKPEPTMQFIEVVKKFTDASIIYQCHDLHYLRLQRKAEVERDNSIRTSADNYKKQEMHIFDSADVILTFSSVEEKIIKESFPQKDIHTVPLYFYDSAVERDTSFKQSSDLLFVGSCAHTPNKDALIWFCEEVFPIILKQIPEMVFNVVGANPPEDVLALRSKNIRILGRVNDAELSELYERSRLAVIPLRYGAGVKGKTIEALYHGLPIVSTSIGLEGIKGVEGLVTPKDNVADFAAEVLYLYNDENKWNDVSLRDTNYVTRFLTSEKAAEQLTNIFASTGQQLLEPKDPGEQPKLIAFYLPQYHPIPENDEWWGKGFTEWRNVAKAEPLFPGHNQPHIPADLGFYDLRCEETWIAQAKLATEYGIHGFCFYHYWFNGKRLLERPVEEMLASGKPDFPFCLCWANENWTRRWDGEDQHLLMELTYSEEDDREHILDLLRFFGDERYIRIDGKPLFLVYRTENMPNPARTAEIWRDEARKHGIGEIYLMRVESIGKCDPAEIGFDAALEFAPDWWNKGVELSSYPRQGGETEENLLSYDQFHADNHVHRYDSLVETMMAKPTPDYKWLQCVTPSWDNTARRKEGAHVFLDATPDKYQRWLEKTIASAESRLIGDEKMVFINAWNEWAEGNYLEPDQEFGRQYLEATRAALRTRH